MKNQGIFGISVLGSGSRGNASVVHGEGGNLLLDAGFSAKVLEERMAREGIPSTSIRAILITHEHSDHTRGCRVFADKYGIPAYMTHAVSLQCGRSGLLPAKTTLFSPGSAFELCGLRIEPFSLPHDAMETVGFVFLMKERKLGVATDLGHLDTLALQKLRGCAILVLESNHDRGLLRDSKRPIQLKRRIMGRHGHLSNDDALAAFSELLTEETRSLILAHLSSECNRAELLRNLAVSRLESIARGDILLEVARQDAPLETQWIF